jgi:hypothetical protein
VLAFFPSPSLSLCVWHMVRPTSTHYITRRDL